MEFLQSVQLNLMLVLVGICFLLAVLAIFTRSLKKQRKILLISIELSSMFLLLFDRYAYIYRGDLTNVGFVMVRVSNFMVFFLELYILLLFDFYITDLYKGEGGLVKTPLRLRVSAITGVVGLALIIISQFTGIYYTFDEFNRYQRAGGYMICYVIPFIMMVLQVSVVIQYRRNLSRTITVSLLLFAAIPLAATVIQIFAYGLSLTNISIAGAAVFLYILCLRDLNDRVIKANQLQIDFLKEQQNSMQALFEETTEALATAIDAKDPYTHGHSSRVAEYARRLARETGSSEKECEEVYYAALLHDVGKIGIADKIINKEGKLSDDEFSAIKQHPVIGRQILSSIGKSPYLCLAANYHHERYDGKGYPEQLKGEDIPKIARIIAVADAYDAMTSKRSYRDPLPQEKVREELVEGLGTQFDPVYGKMMIHFMDLDTEFVMRERIEVREFEGNHSVYCDEYRSDFSEGILLTPSFTRIRFRMENGSGSLESYPALIVFDSTDGRIPIDSDMRESMHYYEYAELRIGGEFMPKGVRNHTLKTTFGYDNAAITLNKDEYEIHALKIIDHILLLIYGDGKATELVMAGPDNTRYAYLSLTGQNCKITDVEIKVDSEPVRRDYIPRIAPEISFIDVPAGDVPNIQLDGWRTAATAGIELKDLMQISFHSFSLPTARLIWHCPFVSIFSSDDGLIGGPNFREFALIRLDGESWEEDSFASNRIITNKSEDFGNWDEWKRKNKEGLDVDIRIKHVGDTITVSSENAGIGFRNVTTIRADVPKLYVALTGDQCAITNIRIR